MTRSRTDSPNNPTRTPRSRRPTRRSGRGDDDNRSDHEVKRDIYKIVTEDHGFNIVRAIDDNPKIIDLWQELGIPTEIVPGWSEEEAQRYADAAVRHQER